MKDPYRQVRHPLGYRSECIRFRRRCKRRIEDAAGPTAELRDESADHHDGGESIRIAGRQVPAPVDARRVACVVDSRRIAGELRERLINSGQCRASPRALPSRLSIRMRMRSIPRSSRRQPKETMRVKRVSSSSLYVSLSPNYCISQIIMDNTLKSVLPQSLCIILHYWDCLWSNFQASTNYSERN